MEVFPDAMRSPILVPISLTQTPEFWFILYKIALSAAVTGNAPATFVLAASKYHELPSLKSPTEAL